MWEVDPSRRCCRSCRKPLLIASAMTSDATPAATPAIEMPVMIPIKDWRRLARRYRLAMKSSKRMDLSAVSPQPKSDYSGKQPPIRPLDPRQNCRYRNAIAPELISKAPLQLCIFHADHHRACADGEHRQDPAGYKPGPYAPRDHLAQVGQVDRMTHASADSSGDQAALRMVRANFG